MTCLKAHFCNKIILVGLSACFLYYEVFSNGIITAGYWAKYPYEAFVPYVSVVYCLCMDVHHSFGFPVK